MPQYTIQVQNNSGFAQSYVVFMEKPIVRAASRPEVFATAWATLDIASGGNAPVIYEDATYAAWGTFASQLAPGVVLTSGGTAPVDLAQGPSVLFTGLAPAGFRQGVPASAPPGAFAIVAGADFTWENHYVFGVASQGRLPHPTAIAVFLATPNETFIVTPVVKFHVTDQSCDAGQILGVPASPDQVATIDFTKGPQTSATVIQDDHGRFSVQLS